MVLNKARPQIDCFSVHYAMYSNEAIFLTEAVYTKFSESLHQITVAKPGKFEDFIKVLQEKLNRKRSVKTPPSNFRLDEML